MLQVERFWKEIKQRYRIKGDNLSKRPNMGRNWYSSHLKVIAFHDIVPGSNECVGRVPRFWQEIKSSYEFMEIVEDWNRKGYGIGIIKRR